MCGIFGLINKVGNADGDVVARMTKLVAHRGPDGQGVLVRGNVGLGHRRLAVIDLSKEGAQPMRDATHPVWIVFNGEIYNYRELRSQLERGGYTFHSSTDTEVLLSAYLEWEQTVCSILMGCGHSQSMMSDVRPFSVRAIALG